MLRKIFQFRNSPERETRQIPQIRVETSHLIGPGKLTLCNNNLVFETESGKQALLHLDGIQSVLVYGNVTLTPNAISSIHKAGAELSLLSNHGDECLGCLVADDSSRVLSRLLHFKGWDSSSWKLGLAQELVVGKIHSQQAALRHYQRQGKKPEKSILSRLDVLANDAIGSRSVDQLRGLEGASSALWWKAFGGLFRRPWVFESRNRRPPTDPINSLLSLGYMQLYRKTTARIKAQGYEPSLGALHEFRPGRMSLACDLMEPLRVPVVDRWVYALIQQGIVQPKDFTESSDSAGVRLVAEKLPYVLQSLEEHWHQGLFRLHLDEWIRRFRCSLRMVANETSRELKQWIQTVPEQSAGVGEVLEQEK